MPFDACFINTTRVMERPQVAPQTVSATVLATSSMLSALGDVGILSAFALAPHGRQLLTTRLVACLAMADLFGQMPVVGSMQLPMFAPVSSWGGPWCELQAAGNWFALLATWLWTCAFAHAVSAGMNRTSRAEDEGLYHIVCWGLPLLIVTVSVTAGIFGQSDDGSVSCTVCSSEISMGFFSLLWVALVYNAFTLFSVHRQMRNALSSNAAVLDPETAREMHRRVDQLGNRFLLYILTFLVSQLPIALRHLCVLLLGHGPHAETSVAAEPALWAALILLSDALCPLHGFLNAIVYGVSAKGICKDGDGSVENGGNGFAGGCFHCCCCCFGPGCNGARPTHGSACHGFFARLLWRVRMRSTFRTSDFSPRHTIDGTRPLMEAGGAE